MIALGGGKAFIENLKQLDESLKKLRLRLIEIDKERGEIRYEFICDRAVSEELKEKIADYCNNETPVNFSAVSVYITKIVSDAELVKNRIMNYIKANMPSLIYEFGDTDIEVNSFDDVVKYKLFFIKASVTYCLKNNVLNKINRELETNFCDNFIGEIVEKESREEIKLERTVVTINQLAAVQRRYIAVTGTTVIDDATNPQVAEYIEDSAEAGEATLCGKITDIREKTTQKGKPFFILEFTDGTGKTSGLYFTKKTTISRIKKLIVGDEIILRGKIAPYNDKMSLTIDKINLCHLPENFIPEPKKSKVAELDYKLIRPEKLEEIKEITMFKKDDIPEYLLEREFVAFDLETTGLEPLTDEITEIGAVKIVGGVVTESFTTLVKPSISIPNKIVELTGIDDELVKNSPSFQEVLPDFYKFTRGATLIAHNADFDAKFIKVKSKELGYVFDNKVEDTLQLSRQLIFGLGNYKLDTVADHFGVKFTHHRALSDARAAADIFIELMKIKKSL